MKNDQKPPFKYHHLIIQAIIESGEYSPYLNIILKWFKDNFEYFAKTTNNWEVCFFCSNSI